MAAENFIDNTLFTPKIIYMIMVTNSPYNASALPILRKLGWQTVNDLILKEILKMVYKYTG